MRSFLFCGHRGTDKTLVTPEIATETRAVLYDLSSHTIKDVSIHSKKQSEKLIAMVMMTAKKYQSAVINIDECEKVFVGKKKRKRG